MLSKNRLKQLRSFHQKKYRDAEQVFIVEGEKLVGEVIREEFAIVTIVATEAWANKNLAQECEIVTEEELAKVSLLQTPQNVFAIVRRKGECKSAKNNEQSLILALDGVQDPGNMGTIIRTAEWFGISCIVCSKDCVDVYNPKVVQATMGAILRVAIEIVDLPQFLAQTEKPIYGAFLEGENIYNSALAKDAIVVMGNEGNGISPKVESLVTQKMLIPAAGSSKSESLNVATATSIICSEFFRRG